MFIGLTLGPTAVSWTPKYIPKMDIFLSLFRKVIMIIIIIIIIIIINFHKFLILF